MRVLVISSHGDYLADSLLHGFRSILGADAVDFPRSELLYRDCPEIMKRQQRGYGFTLHSGLLEDIPVDRYLPLEKARGGHYDLVVFSDIWRHFGVFVQLAPFLKPGSAIVCDGADTTAPYPAAGRWWRNPCFWFLPRAHRRFLYFKREWSPETRFSPLFRLLPKAILSLVPPAANLRKIAFSFPEEKIAKELPAKDKDFPLHIVDPEVCVRVPGSVSSYAFQSEKEYYEDLQRSRFGITVKRAGWDCLRHYEIAANGAVPCVRDLEKKPETCAPHGWNETNCVIYHSADDLFAKVRDMTPENYGKLQKNALAWVRSQSTAERARQVLAEWERYRRSLRPDGIANSHVR